ncbi:hypothetical protein A3860_38780 [Niastella vici]|uniref:Uncharacterized protein n=1 Tax=Niastella vici TaxID=1703345 RepID=A0A1V9FLE3_9BACT|nr:hypothetical protein [Niastella vici]OQP59117.1 hypothetical protein A3860_38780 [Niastella vici]
MVFSLSRKQALGELQSILEKWNTPPLKHQGFLMELWFLDFFAYIIERMPDTDNIIPEVEKTIELALKESFLQICRVLDKHNTIDGSEIFNLMTDNEFVLSNVRKAYNKKIVEKSPKGLRRTDWIAYNNWLLTSIYWKAFIWSHDPGFQIDTTDEECWRREAESLFHKDYKPLAAMRQAFFNSGNPYVGFDGNRICVRPEIEWHRFMKKRNTSIEHTPETHHN